jgi:hypothetical protein
LINWPRFRAWLWSWLYLPDALASDAKRNRENQAQIVGHLIMIRKALDEKKPQQMVLAGLPQPIEIMDWDAFQAEELRKMEDDMQKHSERYDVPKE